MRGVYLFILYDKYIIPTSLRDPSLGIKDNSLISPFDIGLNLGQDVVQIIEALDIRGQGIGGVSANRDTDGGQADLIEASIHRPPLNCNDDYRGLPAFQWIQAQISISSGNYRPDIGIAQVVLAQRISDRQSHLLLAQGDTEHDGLSRIKEPPDMILQPEDPSSICSYALEDTIAIEKTMIENRNRSVFSWNIFTININKAHRESCISIITKDKCILIESMGLLWKEGS